MAYIGIVCENLRDSEGMYKTRGSSARRLEEDMNINLRNLATKL